jgi:hypothetical protein
MPVRPPSNAGKWVAIGCGGLLLVALAVGLIGWFGLQKFLANAKDTAAYKEASAAALASDDLKSALGEPLELGDVTSRNISTNNGETASGLVFSVKGRRARPRSPSLR